MDNGTVLFHHLSHFFYIFTNTVTSDIKLIVIDSINPRVCFCKGGIKFML